jgi:hypothetical protein
MDCLFVTEGLFLHLKASGKYIARKFLERFKLSKIKIKRLFQENESFELDLEGGNSQEKL